MGVRPLDCLAPAGGGGRLLHAVRPAGLADFYATLPAPAAMLLQAGGFTAAAGAPVLVPVGDDIAAVVGLGEDRSHLPFGDLARLLPAGDWVLAPGDHDGAAAVLGFCLGGYSYDRFRTPARAPARLVQPAGTQAAAFMAQTLWMVRDLINAPANVLGPAELATALQTIGAEAGASVRVLDGGMIADLYPAIGAVGAAATSARQPRVAILHWRGSGAAADAPLVSLCGKGVVFDTGGLDLKPSAGMLRMKKDMGGAAIVLGVARALMQLDLPIRLAVRLGCVENAVSGGAMRPGDVLRTRAGLTVEVGNTDAEGRLVLADLLHEACEEQPDLLIDVATLTGAARVALGPDLPALFCNDDAVAELLLAAGQAEHDCVWRLPLWPDYASWLASPVADLNNVSAKPLAGAIVAGLFLQRFVQPATPWAHIDAYAWNDTARPARPEGGEAQAVRMIVSAVAAAMNAPGSGLRQPHK